MTPTHDGNGRRVQVEPDVGLPAHLLSSPSAKPAATVHGLMRGGDGRRSTREPEGLDNRAQTSNP
jgi:hypothetical protein